MIDTAPIHQYVDLLILIGRDTVLKLVASTNGGEYTGPCPFCGGHDRFRVWPNDDRPHWWCRQCEKHGDAIAYMVERGAITLQEAGRLRRGGVGVSTSRAKPKPKQEKLKIPDCEDLQTRAMQVAVDCAAMLWEPEGEKALAELRARGLSDETLKTHFIGYCNKREWTPEPEKPWVTGGKMHGLFVWYGITIPHWQESTNTLSGIKIRLAEYRSVAGSCPSLYLADNLMGHDIAVICEGELDALLLHQEAGDLVGVCGLGSADNKMKAIDAGLPFLLHVKRLLVATDNDADGEKAAAYLLERTKRARRLRPPQGNDITDSWEAGVDLRAWMSEALGDVVGP
jgi:DNA primase